MLIGNSFFAFELKDNLYLFPFFFLHCVKAGMISDQFLGTGEKEKKRTSASNEQQ